MPFKWSNSFALVFCILNDYWPLCNRINASEMEKYKVCIFKFHERQMNWDHIYHRTFDWYQINGIRLLHLELVNRIFDSYSSLWWQWSLFSVTAHGIEFIECHKFGINLGVMHFFADENGKFNDCDWETRVEADSKCFVQHATT